MKISSKKSSENRKFINISIQFSEHKIGVGKLVLDNRTVYFQYTDEFLTLGLNLSPIKLKFDNSIQMAKPYPFNGLFGVFDDSLPDGWGILYS